MRNADWRQLWLGAAGVVAALGLWAALPASGAVSAVVLPGPLEVLKVGFADMSWVTLGHHVSVSLLRIVVGFAAGAAVAVVAGVVLGVSRLAESLLHPIVEVLRPIPPLAWIPLAIVWFGIGEGSKVFLIALATFFPVFVGTYKGVSLIDPVLIRASRALDTTRFRMIFGVIIPAAMPDIAIGLRLGWSMAFVVMVAAEMIAAKSGVGWLIMHAMQIARFDQVIFGVLLIGVLSVASDAAWHAVIRAKLLHWHVGIHASRG